MSEKCLKCGSERIMGIYGKTSDCFNAYYKNYEYDGYVLGGIGIGGGDDIEFEYCLECGQIQSIFPVEDPEIEEDNGWGSLEERNRNLWTSI